MMLTRRRLFTLAGSALAAVGLDKFAPPIQPKRLVLVADGVTDDSAALQAWVENKPVTWADGSPVGSDIRGRSFFLGTTLDLRRHRGPQRSITYCNFRSAKALWA